MAAEKAPVEIEGFKPVGIGDRQAISALLAEEKPRTSELSFTNMFMWRQYYRPAWREAAGGLLVVCQPEDKPAFGLPPAGGGDPAAALAALAEAMQAAGLSPRLERVGEEFLNRAVDPSEWAAEKDRDQSDYVYRVKDLIELSGGDYEKKRNHLNYFQRHYDYEAAELDEALVPEVLELQADWCRLKECDLKPGLHNEDLAVREALDHFGDLDYRGLVVKVDGRVAAFSLGEALNTDTVVVHAEKADPDVRGLYVAVNQLFLERLWSRYSLVNREQDLGVRGLRQAKESYHPDHLVDKYVLTPK